MIYCTQEQLRISMWIVQLQGQVFLPLLHPNWIIFSRRRLSRFHVFPRRSVDGFDEIITIFLMNFFRESTDCKWQNCYSISLLPFHNLYDLCFQVVDPDYPPQTVYQSWLAANNKSDSAMVCYTYISMRSFV